MTLVQRLDNVSQSGHRSERFILPRNSDESVVRGKLNSVQNDGDTP